MKNSEVAAGGLAAASFCGVLAVASFHGEGAAYIAMACAILFNSLMWPIHKILDR